LNKSRPRAHGNLESPLTDNSMLSIKGLSKNISGGKMTSLLDGISKMIGSMLKLTGAAAPCFHVGGRVSGEALDMLASHRSHHFVPRGHVIFQGNPLSRGGLVGDGKGHGDFVIQIKMEPGRKRPITGDMVQMCQDLGIEPNTTMEDFRRIMEQHQKRIQQIMAVPPHMIDRRWAR